VQLTNTGTAPLTISNVAVTGDNAADFAISSDNCPPAPATLGAGASCTVEVTFTPHASGARDATLAVTDDSYYLPHTLPLAGTGVTPAAGAATLSTGSVDFGNQGLGVTSSPQPVTLTNTGTAPLTISTMSLVDSEFGMTSTCPTGGASLAVGASCEIDATFTPSAMGLQTASIDVSSDAVNGTVEIALSGSGVLPPGTFLSESFDPEANVWSSTSNTTVPSVQAGAGRNGTAGLVVPDSVAAYTTLQPGVTAETHTRFCFDVSTLWAGPLVQGRDANGFHLWEVDLDGPAQGLDVYVWDASGARLDAYIAHVVAAGQWNCADVDLAQAAAGHLDVTLNGTTIVATPADFSGSALSRLYLWGPATFDDVSVASS
jgi:hypothetical protein